MTYYFWGIRCPEEAPPTYRQWIDSLAWPDWAREVLRGYPNEALWVRQQGIGE